jgi:hypothetical protein
MSHFFFLRIGCSWSHSTRSNHSWEVRTTRLHWVGGSFASWTIYLTARLVNDVAHSTPLSLSLSAHENQNTKNQGKESLHERGGKWPLVTGAEQSLTCAMRLTNEMIQLNDSYFSKTESPSSWQWIGRTCQYLFPLIFVSYCFSFRSVFLISIRLSVKEPGTKQILPRQTHAF